MKKSSRKEIQRGNIVKEWMIGNTTIRIDDFYFRNNTPEQNQEIVNNFYAIGMRIARQANGFDASIMTLTKEE